VRFGVSLKVVSLPTSQDRLFSLHRSDSDLSSFGEPASAKHPTDSEERILRLIVVDGARLFDTRLSLVQFSLAQSMMELKPRL